MKILRNWLRLRGRKLNLTENRLQIHSKGMRQLCRNVEKLGLEAHRVLL